MKKYATWVVFAAFLSLIFFMNWTYVFCSDDCFYGVMWNGHGWQRVGTIWNAFCLEVVDNHRPFVHFISRIFCGCYPKWVFNIFNTAVMGMLLLLANRLATKSWRPNWKSMSVMCALTFFALCKGESYLWGCGSINYLWTGAMTLVFCLIREHLEEDTLSTCATWLLLIPAALIGSANEAFSPPVCFGLALTSLISFKKLNWKKLLIYGAYGLAAIILCLIEAQRRSQQVPEPSLMTIVISTAKVIYTCKCVWVLALIFVFMPQKFEFVKKNIFELTVIGSSIIIGIAIGFVGERILWITNLMAIVIIVRVCSATRFWAFTSLAALIITTWFVIPLGVRIRHNFDSFLNEYSEAKKNIVCQDYTPCGIWGRFFFQIIYGWQAMGYHPHAFSRYYGRPEVYPLGLTREVYDKVYQSDEFRRAFNKLPLPFDAYEVPHSNTIVIPINHGSDQDKPFNEVDVTYQSTGSMCAKVLSYIDGLGRPVLPFPDYPVRLTTRWGDCWLVARKPSDSLIIKSVSLKITDRKHPDDGAWWCADCMKKATSVHCLK